MSSDIENLTVQTDKLSTEPIFNTNWCDLKPNMKLEVIERMKLKERLLLRSTSKTEKGLVESSPKMKIPFLEYIGGINSSHLTFGTKRYVNYTTLKFRTNPEKKDYKIAIPCFKVILRLADFESLVFSFPPRFNFTEEFAIDNLTVNELELEKCSEEDLLHFLRILNPEVKVIKLNADDDDDYEFPFDKILDIPTVINCPFWQVARLYRSDSAVKVAQIWIDKDAEIGKTYQFVAMKEGTTEEFLKAFSERKIDEECDGFHRIRTENPEKHIVLEMGLDHSDEYTNVEALQFMRLMVIPSDMKNSEYDWETNKWMNLLDPNYYFPGEKCWFDSDSSCCLLSGGEWEIDSD